MNEIWIDIKGYENLYQISNLGNVKSLNYRRMKKEQVLIPREDKLGYLYVTLRKNGKNKTHKIHRLVGEHFIPNNDNKPCIDHINTIRTDNRVENLRWCTHKENSNNPLTIIKLSSKARKQMIGRYGKLNPKSKPIFQYTLDNKFIKKWNSAMDVKRELEISNTSISSCCNGKLNSAGGFIWRYAS